MWQFAPNSIHYLLSLWQRMVASVPYVKVNYQYLFFPMGAGTLGTRVIPDTEFEAGYWIIWLQIPRDSYITIL